MNSKKSSYQFDIGWLIFLAVLGLIGYRNFQYHRSFWLVSQLEPGQLKHVKIYHETAVPSNECFELRPSEQAVSELLDSFGGSRAVWLPHRFDSSDGFFLELVTEDRKIQGVFRLPTGKTYFVGEFGNWRQSSQTFYGEFRSKKLFLWYRKYRHLWLEQNESQEFLGAGE